MSTPSNEVTINMEKALEAVSGLEAVMARLEAYKEDEKNRNKEAITLSTSLEDIDKAVAILKETRDYIKNAKSNNLKTVTGQIQKPINTNGVLDVYTIAKNVVEAQEKLISSPTLNRNLQTEDKGCSLSTAFAISRELFEIEKINQTRIEADINFPNIDLKDKEAARQIAMAEISLLQATLEDYQDTPNSNSMFSYVRSEFGLASPEAKNRAVTVTLQLLKQQKGEIRKGGDPRAAADACKKMTKQMAIDVSSTTLHDSLQTVCAVIDSNRKVKIDATGNRNRLSN